MTTCKDKRKITQQHPSEPDPADLLECSQQKSFYQQCKPHRELASNVSPTKHVEQSLECDGVKHGA